MLQLDTDGKSFDLEKNPNESNDPCFQTLHDSMRIQEPKYQTLPTPASWIDNTADMDPNVGVASPPWAELPAEVLGEVARHLHDAADFMRFHAACRAWRAASSSAPARLYPWLVAPCGLFSSGMCFRWPFSPGEGKGGAYLPHFPALRGRRFDSADAASGRVLAAGTRRRPHGQPREPAHRGRRPAALRGRPGPRVVERRLLQQWRRPV